MGVVVNVRLGEKVGVRVLLGDGVGVDEGEGMVMVKVAGLVPVCAATMPTGAGGLQAASASTAPKVKISLIMYGY